jgi:hypothetical protein
MLSFFQSGLGTIFYSVVIFGLGALVGRPLFSWVNEKMPWNN